MTVAGVSGWVQLLLAVLSLASVGGLFIAYLRVGYAKSTIEVLKESNAAHKLRNQELEEEKTHILTKHATQLAKLESKVELLVETNKILNDALSNKQSNDEILKAINEHHQEYLANNQAFNARYTEGQTTVGLKIDSVYNLGVKALDKLDTLSGDYNEDINVH